MLRGDDRHLAHVVRELEVREELARLFGVRLHVRELGVVELSRLLEEFVTHGDLPVVVQERRRPQLLQLDPRETHTPADHLGVARDPLAVTGGLLVARVDRHRERLDEGLPEAALLGHELRVLDGDRGRRAERCERLLVLLGKTLAAVFVHDLKHADDAAVLTLHRESQEAPRAIPAPLVVLRIEARVPVRVRDVDGLAGLSDGARDPDADRLPDLVRAGPERDARPDLVPLAVDDEDGRAVGIEELGRRFGHVPQERVQVGDRHEPARHVENHVKTRPRRHLAVGRSTELGPALGRATLLRHQPSSGMCSRTGPTVSAICSSSI